VFELIFANKQYKFFMEKKREGQEKLRPEEIQALRKLNHGYGRFVGNARRVGLHQNTYRYIIDRGHGTAKLVRMIRANLLTYNQYESHPYQPAQN
jgi:hypothetical protein